MLTNQYVFDALLPAVEMYQAFIDDSHDKLRDEFELWKQCRHAAVEPPKTALDAYTARNASLYQNLSILLQLFRIPFMKILDPPLKGNIQVGTASTNKDIFCHHLQSHL